MTAIEAIRDRYDGEKRNPWNEFECGSNYARSMASYSLLNAFSGFQFDMVQGLIGFDPIQAEEGRFRCFWSLDSGWGTFRMEPEGATIHVLYGELGVNGLCLPFIADWSVRAVELDGRSVCFAQDGADLRFGPPAVIRE